MKLDLLLKGIAAVKLSTFEGRKPSITGTDAETPGIIDAMDDFDLLEAWILRKYGLHYEVTNSKSSQGGEYAILRLDFDKHPDLGGKGYPIMNFYQDEKTSHYMVFDPMQNLSDREGTVYNSLKDAQAAFTKELEQLIAKENKS